MSKYADTPLCDLTMDQLHEELVSCQNDYKYNGAMAKEASRAMREARQSIDMIITEIDLRNQRDAQRAKMGLPPAENGRQQEVKVGA